MPKPYETITRATIRDESFLKRLPSCDAAAATGPRGAVPGRVSLPALHTLLCSASSFCVVFSAFPYPRCLAPALPPRPRHIARSANDGTADALASPRPRRRMWRTRPPGIGTRGDTQGRHAHGPGRGCAKGVFHRRMATEAPAGSAEFLRDQRVEFPQGVGLAQEYRVRYRHPR